MRWNGLRPTQADAVGPILDGQDTLVLAPTAGGKTEAAVFPCYRGWPPKTGRACPCSTCAHCGRCSTTSHPASTATANGWAAPPRCGHGDVGQPQRQRILLHRPDILLTTPESLEAMLVSTKVDPRLLFSGLQAIVVDEIHAFAGDDRGWHLLAVLERLSRIAGRDLQRIGLSATVGNPDELLSWLQGGFHTCPRTVVAPHRRHTQHSRGHRGLRRIGGQRCHRHLITAPRRETTGLRRKPPPS